MEKLLGLRSHNLRSIIPDPQNPQLDLPFVRKEIERSDIRKSSFPEKCIFFSKNTLSVRATSNNKTVKDILSMF